MALSINLRLLPCCMQMTPVYHVIEDLLHRRNTGVLPHRLWPLTRALVVGVVALVGALVPDMETMVSLTGSIAFSAIGFILPGVFFLRLQPAAGPPSWSAQLPREGTAGLPSPTGHPSGGGGGGSGSTSGFSVHRMRHWWDQIVAVLLIITGLIGGTLGVLSNL